MVADEQRAALRRNVLAPDHADFVKRMRRAPQQKPQQRVRQNHQRVNGARERQHAAGQKNGAGRKLQLLRQQPVRAGREKNPDEREQVGRRERFAPVGFFRAVLQQRRDGHDEKSARETEQRQPHERGGQGQITLRERRRKNRQAERAERHEAVFDLAAGQITRRHAAEADAQRERDVEETDFGFVHVQHVRAVKKQVQQQQRAQKVEIRVADGGEKQRAVPAPDADLRPDLAGKIRAEFFPRVRRRHARGDGRRQPQGD